MVPMGKILTRNVFIIHTSAGPRHEACSWRGTFFFCSSSSDKQRPGSCPSSKGLIHQVEATCGLLHCSAVQRRQAGSLSRAGKLSPDPTPRGHIKSAVGLCLHEDKTTGFDSAKHFRFPLKTTRIHDEQHIFHPFHRQKCCQQLS